MACAAQDTRSTLGSSCCVVRPAAAGQRRGTPRSPAADCAAQRAAFRPACPAARSPGRLRGSATAARRTGTRFRARSPHSSLRAALRVPPPLRRAISARPRPCRARRPRRARAGSQALKRHAWFCVRAGLEAERRAAGWG